MQPSPIRDFVVGLFVLAGLAALAYLSIQVGGLSYKGPGGLELIASFDEIGGLAVRAPVAISGVKVGQVSRIELDPTLRARVTLDLDPSLKLPVDSRAAIRTSGLLGDQFIALEPGGEEELLKSGEEIAFTDPALSLERLIGKFVNNAGLDDKDKKE
jgi:phospholipid/cholesterol/gamma-HCH transport system substrate-binding protein